MKELVKKQPIKDLALRIAREAPELEDLTQEQLERLAGAVIIENLKDDLKHQADLAGIDYAEEKKIFLENAGRVKSIHTRLAYTKAMNKLDAWAAKRGIGVLEMRFKDADDFIYAISAEGKSPASVRMIVSGTSSFFSFLERRHESIRNPFRGTKARPVKKAVRRLDIPDQKEVKAIIDALDEPYRTAAIIMACRGLRIGALPSLSIRGERFTATSKGKEISGILPAEAIRAIKKGRLDPREPFKSIEAEEIRNVFRYEVKKLFKAGMIKAAYSVHDLRHYFSIQEYNRDYNIHRLKELLHHSGIGTTEMYLKGIGVL